MDPKALEALKRDLKLAELVSAANVGVETQVLAALIAEIERLERENARLMAGNFTAEEFQNLCHSKDVQDGFEAFADGCDAYQQKMFGRCRTNERIGAMKTLQEIRDDIQNTTAGDTDRILDICLEIVLNLQRIEREVKTADRIARDAALGQQ